MASLACSVWGGLNSGSADRPDGAEGAWPSCCTTIGFHSESPSFGGEHGWLPSDYGGNAKPKLRPYRERGTQGLLPIHLSAHGRRESNAAVMLVQRFPRCPVVFTHLFSSARLCSLLASLRQGGRFHDARNISQLVVSNWKWNREDGQLTFAYFPSC